MPSKLTDNWLLWLDLETTGSDVEKDCIIEIGCILTDAELHAKGEFSAVVSPPAEPLGRMFQNEVVYAMHKKNGLLDDVLATDEKDNIHRTTPRLMEWLEELGAPKGKLVLAGSGVAHFDSKFIRRYMPHFAGPWLRYWTIDVGVLRRSAEMFAGIVPTFPRDETGAHSGKTHRALDDARVHLEEGRFWRDFYRKVADA